MLKLGFVGGMRQGELFQKLPLEPLKTFVAGVCLSACLWTVVWFAELGSKEFFSFMGLRKRDFSATGGSESGEADPVDHGENLLLRSSAPTFSRVGNLRDPDADAPHDSFGG